MGNVPTRNHPGIAPEYAQAEGSLMRLGYLSGAPRVSTRPDVGAGGPRAHVLGVMRAFETLGWEVKPFILGDLLPIRVADAEDFINGNRWKALLADVGRLTLGVANARRAWRVLGEQVDWIYERLTALQSLGRVFQRHGIPWILETNAPLFHEASPERENLALTGLAGKLELIAYRRCDVLVCVNRILKDFVVREAEVNPDKVLVVPDGADIAFFDPLRHSPRRIFPGFTAGFVGSLYPPQAGLDLLLRAMAELRKERVRINLVVVGDGFARGEWENLARTLSLAEQVRFVGRVAWDEVPSYIAGFDIGYSGQLPLQSGVMYLSPIKLYEYMAMAKPVIAAAFEDARTLVEGKNTGFLFQPGNEEDLKRALRDAYMTREALPEMGRLARQEIVERHSWTARVREMVPQVETILRRNAGR